MTRIIEILISFAIVAALLLVIGVVLPSHRSLSESVETNRRPTIVYDTLNSLRRFKDWNPLLLRAPAADLQLAGPVSGKGAKLAYTTDVQQVGNGSWAITESVPGKSVKYALENDFRGTDKTMLFTLTPTGRGNVKRNVQISQKYSVDYGWDLIGRYAGLYIKSHVGDDMKVGLSRLSNMLASVPNVDYAAKGTTLRGMTDAQRPAEDLLVVKAGAISRDNAGADILKSMKANREWINRTMAANNLVAAGPLRILTTELGRETYTFDVAQPVRKAGAGEKVAEPAKVDDKKNADQDADAVTDEAAEVEAATTPPVDAVVPPVAAGAPMTVKIPDGAPVEYMQTKPTHVAMGYFTGNIAGLDSVHNAMRAWALTQGYEVVDRPYDVYKDGIDKSFDVAQIAAFETYWTLKN